MVKVGRGRHNVKMFICVSVYLVTFSRPLIGQKYECYIVKEVIEVDELGKSTYQLLQENETNNERLS